jgi:hypothetical protein
MKTGRMKHRVPFYYLIAEHAGKLTDLSTSRVAVRSSSLHAKNAVVSPHTTANSGNSAATSSAVSEGTVVTRAVSKLIQPSTTPVLAAAASTAVLSAAPAQPLFIVQRVPQGTQANPVVAAAESYEDDLETTSSGFFSRIRAWFSSENVNGQYRPL